MSIISQAGAIVFRTDGHSVQVLLVRARKNAAHWVFPKGHLEPHESHAAAALREAWEEAGVLGVVVGLVGPSSSFQAGDEQIRVEYYLLHMTAETASREGREKQWVSAADALERLTFQDARDLLRTALPEMERRMPGGATNR